MHLRGLRIFLQTAARDFKRTGALAPSSRSLGRAMTSRMAPKAGQPTKVIEVGGGSGSITEVIAQRLARGDCLDVYEIDDNLAAVIRDRFTVNHSYQDAGISIRVFSRPIEEIELAPRYDHVISCLPFTNFSPASIERIFEIYRSLLKPGGTCSFYEYLLVRRAAGVVKGAGERERVTQVTGVVRQYTDRYCFGRDYVFINLPPAQVYHLRFDDSIS